MRVGIILDNEFNHDSRVRKQVELLKRSGHSIYVLCYAFDKKKYDDIEGINITRIGIKRTYRNIFFLLFHLFPFYETLWKNRIRKLIEQHNIQVVHVHDLYMSKAARKAIKRSGKKIRMVLDLHENYPAAVKTYNWTKGFIRKLLSQPEKWAKKEEEYLSYADRLIVLSGHFKHVLLQRFRFLEPGNIYIFPNFPDTERLRNIEIHNVEIKKPEYPVLLYFGVLGERRGVFSSLEVLRKLLRKNIRATLLCIGPVDKADRGRFQKYMNDSEIRDYLIHIPWIDIEMLPSYLAISDIALAPFQKNAQHDSGVANKIYQYMFGKLPVVASNCTPQQELIERYNCGLIYENEDQFLGSLIKLIGSEKLREEMGSNGRDAIINKIDFSIYDQNLLKAIGND